MPSLIEYEELEVEHEDKPPPRDPDSQDSEGQATEGTTEEKE